MLGSMSPMRCHTDLPAVFEHRAGRAFRTRAGTDVLAEWHEQPIDLDPVALWQHALEGGHRLFRCSRRDHAPPVRDAVDMNVDADRRPAAGNAEREIGALGADAVE